MIKFAIKREEKNIQIGLDMGSHSVKAVAISHAKTQPQLVGFSIRPVKDNVIKAVKDAHADLGLTRRKAVSSVSGAAVIVRYVEMPSMTDEELKSSVRFEAEKVIPYNIDEVILDSARIEGLTENRMRAVIVAVKKDLVDTQMKMLNEAEIEPVILDIDSFAVMNAFTNAKSDPGSVCGLINIGAKTTNLNIVKGESSYLCRDIDIGGNQITDAVSEALSLKDADADSVKIEKVSRIPELPDEEKNLVKTAVEGVFFRLADEIRLSFDFYENRYTANIDKIYLSGGTSRLDGISDLLKDNLSIDVLRWDPLAGIEIASGLDVKLLNEAKPQLAVAVGLALRRPL